MKQGARFFVVFALQGIMVVAMFAAMRSANSDMVTFTAGAALMLFVLMLIIWLLSVISKDINDKNGR